MSEITFYENNLNQKKTDNEFYDSLSFSNLKYIISYIYENYIQFILLICVFLIIYIVDRINNYNNMLLGLSQIPQIPGFSPSISQQQINFPNKLLKTNKKRRKQ